MKRTIVIACGMAAAIVASPAFAGVTYSGYTVLNNQTVTINGEPSGAGQITLDNIDGNGNNQNVWCVDIADVLLDSGDFTGVISPVVTAWAPEVNALITNGEQLLSTNYDASAALQVAIWKTVFPGVDITASNGNILTLADAFLDDVSDGDWKVNPDPQQQMIELTALGNQSQAFVPEPMSIAILGFGIFAMAMQKRYRR
jgi:hypothetical protein